MKRFDYYMQEIASSDIIGNLIIYKKNKVSMVPAKTTNDKHIIFMDNEMPIIKLQLSNDIIEVKINKNIVFKLKMDRLKNKIKLSKDQIIKRNKKSINVNYQYFTIESSWLNLSFNDSNLLKVLDKVFKKSKIYDYLDNKIEKSYKKYRFEVKEKTEDKKTTAVAE